MRIPPVALLPVLLLAGCLGAGPDAPETATSEGTASAGPHGEHAAGVHLLAPEWAVGDYWTMQSPQGGQFTNAVSGESGTDWTMDTDNPDTAFFDAVSDISFLGKVRKADLAGSQGDARVEFLKFPLTAGMSWTTTWDGAPTMIHVGEVADGKAEVTAMRADGSTYAKYTYSDEAGYFSHFAFYSPDGSTVGYEWTLQKSGSGFTGQLVRWTLAELFAASGPIPQGQSGMFTVEPGFTDIYVTAALDCQTGAVAIAAGPPTGPAEDRGYTAQGPCPLQDFDAYPLTAPTQQEQWGGIVTGAPMTTGTLELHFYGRTQVTFTAGKAP
ncbi:MAG TPA: hypothetical protein VM327_04345 [Candidatus Thermoplasmatota archaeon]|nr:hypothetical protein [Candidatus Thermoplasmatota archaeon]